MIELSQEQIEYGVTIGGEWRGPTAEEWFARIMSYSLNDGGAPTWRDWQTEREAPDHNRPFIDRGVKS